MKYYLQEWDDRFQIFGHSGSCRMGRKVAYLLVFEFFDLPAVTLGGTSYSTVAFLKTVLAYHLNAFVFFFGGEIGHGFFDQFCTHAVVEQLLDLYLLVELLNDQIVDVAHLYFMGRFYREAFELDTTGFTRLSGKAASLIEAHSPKVFVDAKGFVHSEGLYFSLK